MPFNQNVAGMRNRLVLLTNGVGHGLTHINTEIAIQLAAAKPSGWSLLIIAPRKEQHHGLLVRLKNSVSDCRVHVVDDWSDVVGAVTEECVGAEKIVCQCQGVCDFLSLRSVRKKYGQLRLVGITHAYRNYEGYLKRKLFGFIHSTIYRVIGDHLIFQSDSVSQDFYAGRKMLRQGTASVIPLGVESLTGCDELDLEDPVVQVVASVKDSGDPYYIYLARFGRGKNHEALIGYINEMDCSGDAKFVFLGFGPDLEKCRELVREKGLEGSVFLPGRIHRKYVLWALKGARAAIVCSSNETFGHCYVEPMSIGVPVLGTREGIGKSLLFDYFTGVSFSADDLCSFERGVRFFSGLSEGELQRIGRNCVEITKCFTWENVAVAYWSMYRGMF